LRRRIKVFRNTAKFSLILISQSAQRDFREIIFLDPRLRGDDKREEVILPHRKIEVIYLLDFK
jgi:hypothetical protein